MSTTGPQIVERVYRRLGDNPNAPIIDPVQVHDVVNQCVREIASPMRLGVGQYWVDSILTVGAGDRDYTFPTTLAGVANIEYDQVVSLRYNGTFLPLKRISRDELDAGRALGATATGRQASYALWQGPDQVVNLQFKGFPTQTEALDALISVVPEDWEDGATNPPTIPFSKRAQDALVLLTSAKVGAPSSQDKLDALRLDQKTFQRWEADAERILAEERLRVIGLKMTHGPRNFAWVAGWVL